MRLMAHTECNGRQESYIEAERDQVIPTALRPSITSVRNGVARKVRSDARSVRPGLYIVDTKAFQAHRAIHSGPVGKDAAGRSEGRCVFLKYYNRIPVTSGLIKHGDIVKTSFGRYELHVGDPVEIGLDSRVVVAYRKMLADQLVYPSLATGPSNGFSVSRIVYPGLAGDIVRAVAGTVWPYTLYEAKEGYRFRQIGERVDPEKDVVIHGCDYYSVASPGGCPDLVVGSDKRLVWVITATGDDGLFDSALERASFDWKTYPGGPGTACVSRTVETTTYYTNPQ